MLDLYPVRLLNPRYILSFYYPFASLSSLLPTLLLSLLHQYIVPSTYFIFIQHSFFLVNVFHHPRTYKIFDIHIKITFVIFLFYFSSIAALLSIAPLLPFKRDIKVVTSLFFADVKGYSKLSAVLSRNLLRRVETFAVTPDGIKSHDSDLTSST